MLSAQQLSEILNAALQKLWKEGVVHSVCNYALFLFDSRFNS